jgi:iron complex outermembrane receptor protein
MRDRSFVDGVRGRRDPAASAGCGTAAGCIGATRSRVVRSGLCLAGLVWAAALTAAPERLDDVTVHGDRPAAEDDAVDRAAFVTVIEAADFATTATSVPELLQKSVGVTVRRFGGPGSLATASIRGSSAEQVTVLLDGIPLNRARAGTVNLSNLPLRIVERIEVYRSFAPLRLQPAAIGGVVNIITRRPTEAPTAEARATYGSFGTYELNGAHSARSGRWSHLLAGTLAGSDGDYRFKDDNGTRVEPSDDRTTRRQNNDYDGQDLFGKLAWAGDALSLEATGEHFAKDEGVPGIASNQSRDARLKTRRELVQVRADRPRFLHPALDARGRVFGLWEESRFRDRQGEIGLGRQDSETDTWAAGGDTHLTWAGTEGHVLSLLAAVRHERFDGEDRLRDVHYAEQRRTVYQAGVEDEAFLFGGRLALEPQLVYTYLDNDFEGDPGSVPPVNDAPADEDDLSFRLGGRLTLGPTLAAKFNGGRAFRYPTLTELFGDRGTVVGNPRLRPEESWRWDVGLEFERQGWRLGPLRGDRAVASAAVFYADSSDLILFEQNSQRTVRPVNVSDARVRGLETAVALSLSGWLELKGNFTWTDSENTGDVPFLRGNRLPGVPERELFLRADLRGRHGRLYYEFDYLDDNFLDRANFERVDDRAIHNAGVTVGPLREVSLSFEVKNLTDERVSDVLGFPLPGRAYVATVLGRF